MRIPEKSSVVAGNALSQIGFILEAVALDDDFAAIESDIGPIRRGWNYGN
jgi:hypothetical protein